MPFFLLFIIVPILELMVFVAVSKEIGLLTSLTLALLTAIVGGFIVKQQGIRTLLNARSSISSGGIPMKEMFDGLCLVAAGALLITPGFITDAIGFSLLVPRFRVVLRTLGAKYSKFSAVFNVGESAQNFGYNSKNLKKQHDDVIEAEFENISEKDDDRA